MRKIIILLTVFIVSLSMGACSSSAEKQQTNGKNESEHTQKSETIKIETPLGEGELIPLKSGSGDILEGQNYLKINCKETPTQENIIKTYNELNKSDLNFNYYIIQHGDQGMHFIKNVPIGHVGEIDFDCAPLQPGSQLKETTKYLTIEGNKIIEEEANLD
ncbi:Uncharacterised protein [[Clostridium] sordellii]|uniref:hypothetical protein n=1 Tax=Paraclostridium sordellii TaxID=1505 RepID=UPI0005DD9FAC|nr:hypothetical protein [Paeniclostridium sordellii]CEN84143.1 Uncharacterised protein [[Clostridium] sordellii] [Paeniclostridium sordellii]CEO09695.1 Uncharacterised protein [[Clostridium] sordellii] [Paeniclostridium sordellii]